MIDADGARTLFGYNAWANERTLDALGSVPADVYAADRKSSHGGMHGTMVHVVYAQHLWLLRWLGEPNDAAIAAGKAVASFPALRAYWDDVERRTADFLDDRLTDAFLRSTFVMKTTKGEAFTHTYGEAFLHLAVHSGYHRGQVAGMLRQSGYAPPGTDFILFMREHPSKTGASR